MIKADGIVRILAVGDVVGRPGRRILRQALPLLIPHHQIDAVVVNVENAAGGFGMTAETYREFERMPIDAMTSGNHIYDKKGYRGWMENAPLLLRPENMPPGAAGIGWKSFTLESGVRLGVANIIGRTYMYNYDCPFRAIDRILPELTAASDIILVDFHAEATSEKTAMGHYLSGRVSAIWGTHTHIPTADAHIKEGHTGYITDLGMTGPYDSCIGMKKEAVIHGFRTLEKSRFEVAKDEPRLGGCLLDIDPTTGKCKDIRGLFLGEQELKAIEQTAAAGTYHEVPGTATDTTP